MEIKFKPCGDCNACCTGTLIGTAYGNIFGKKKPCVFLVEQKCSIYKTRPQTCRNYQCAWSQGIIPDWLKPTKSNVLISVEHNDGKQFLKVMNLIDQEINQKILLFLDEWTKEHNTYYVMVER